MDRVEVEVAAFPRRTQRQLVADLHLGASVEVIGHGDVRLAARVLGHEQDAAGRQALPAKLDEPKGDSRRVTIVEDLHIHVVRAARRQQAADGTLGGTETQPSWPGSHVTAGRPSMSGWRDWPAM